MGDLVRCSTFFVRVVFCMILTVDECGIFVAMLRVMRYLWKAPWFGNRQAGGSFRLLLKVLATPRVEADENAASRSRQTIQEHADRLL